MYDEFDNKDEMNYQGTDGVTSEGAGTEPEPTYYGGGEDQETPCFADTEDSESA